VNPGFSRRGRSRKEVFQNEVLDTVSEHQARELFLVTKPHQQTATDEVQYYTGSEGKKKVCEDKSWFRLAN
jgi:hypothetical protein